MPIERGYHYTTLRCGSLAERVVDWLQAHPDEELTARDIAIKFNYRRRNVYERLQVALRAGELVRAPGRPAVFRAGRR